VLDLNELGDGSIPAITPAVGNMLAEGAGVCLESKGHAPGVELIVRGGESGSYRLTWSPITDQALRAWADFNHATEQGAVGIAVLLASHDLGYAVIEASRQGTGIDYWLGEPSDDIFERTGRLEVSGIRQGTESVIGTRVNLKLRQTDRSDTTGKPVVVIVVEFGTPLAEVARK
jgi:hypothetical protein